MRPLLLVKVWNMRRFLKHGLDPMHFPIRNMVAIIDVICDVLMPSALDYVY